MSNHRITKNDIVRGSAYFNVLRDQYIIPTMKSLNHPVECADDLLEYCLTTPGNAIFEESINKFLATQRDSSNGANEDKRPLVTIKHVLSDSDKNYMISTFPEVRLVFSDKDPRACGHALAAAVRVVEYEMILRETPPNTPIVDVGGNFSTHISRGYTHIHSCCPLLDHKDFARQNERIMNLTSRKRAYENGKLIIKDPAAITAFDPTGPNPHYYCNKKAQDCNFKAVMGISVHSAYDISIETWGDIMIKHDMSAVAGCIMVPPEINDDSKLTGNMPHLGSVWTKRMEFDQIDFMFVDDNSLAYTHTLSSLKKYQHPFNFFVDGNYFSYDPKSDRGGSVTFIINRLASAPLSLIDVCEPRYHYGLANVLIRI
ncbi:viral methyltransferase-domain-containing protein [Parasitella parasitica]|nr:viral methyltransferase-domain-containing protein [Parasitella parasitica]